MGPSSGGAGQDQRLDAAVELGREDVVRLGDVFAPEAVGDHRARRHVAVAAMVRAVSSRPSRWSTTITRPAPISHDDWAAIRPTGPAPRTTTVSPSVMSPSWAPK